MNAEQVWELINSQEVGGDDGRREVIGALARIWQGACATSLEQASWVSEIWAVLDNGQFEYLDSSDLGVVKRALIDSGYGELAEQLH